jgi:hypothetical protein
MFVETRVEHVSYGGETAEGIRVSITVGPTEFKVKLHLRKSSLLFLNMGK